MFRRGLLWATFARARNTAPAIVALRRDLRFDALGRLGVADFGCTGIAALSPATGTKEPAH